MLSTPACGLLPGTRLILSRWLSYQIIPSTGIYLKTVTDIEIQIVLVRDIFIIPRSCFSATMSSTRASGPRQGNVYIDVNTKNCDWNGNKKSTGKSRTNNKSHIALAIPLLFLGYYVVYSRVRPAARYSSNSITMIVISNNSVNRDLLENCNRHRNTNRSGTRHMHSTPLLFLGYCVVYSRVRPAARCADIKIDTTTNTSIRSIHSTRGTLLIAKNEYCSCFSATTLSTPSLGLQQGAITLISILLLTLLYVVFVVPAVLYWLPEMNSAPVPQLRVNPMSTLAFAR